MNHRSLSVLVISALVAVFLGFVGCNVSPDESTAAAAGGQTATGGHGGQAGQGGQAGEAGEAGKGGATTTTTSTTTTTTTTEFFSCDDVADGHLVLKIRIAVPAPKFYGADGVVTFPPASGFVTYPADLWGPLFVSDGTGPSEITADVGTIVSAPSGLVPSGTKMVFAPGWSVDDNMDSAQLVDGASWSCLANTQSKTVTCAVDLLCCFGTEEQGRQVDGQGDLEIDDETIGDHEYLNVACSAP